uniref:DUF1640 domain-containing protein n=1 Tax=Candidatus Kentrum sp. LFY TaxID=2126342 RepID=A0A450V2Q6_9GAMM|nr:MAG: hypothetical protein BECKLFY1418A_GA0070994_10934 [Candidatus Kentron sp. LFY]
MNIVAFDTLEFSRTLQGVGFDKMQAEGVLTAFEDAFEEVEFPSIKDIARLDSKIDGLTIRIDSLETRMEVGFKQLRR